MFFSSFLFIAAGFYTNIINVLDSTGRCVSMTHDVLTPYAQGLIGFSFAEGLSYPEPPDMTMYTQTWRYRTAKISGILSG